MQDASAEKEGAGNKCPPRTSFLFQKQSPKTNSQHQKQNITTPKQRPAAASS
jgi:hypothetical protein